MKVEVSRQIQIHLLWRVMCHVIHTSRHHAAADDDEASQAQLEIRPSPLGLIKHGFILSLAGSVFVFPPAEAPVAERPRSEGVTYVNIPISPTSKKQLNYMELELQEPGAGVRGTAAQSKTELVTSLLFKV